jgi:hypothetical protein
MRRFILPTVESLLSLVTFDGMEADNLEIYRQQVRNLGITDFKSLIRL